jgi:hypothetical protein
LAASLSAKEAPSGRMIAAGSTVSIPFLPLVKDVRLKRISVEVKIKRQKELRIKRIS